MSMDYEPGGIDVGLDDIFGFWAGIFEASRRMLTDGVCENAVEVKSFEFYAL